MGDVTRRSFVKSTTGALATFAIAKNGLGANEKLQIGTIGLRNQGTNDSRSFISTGRAVIKAVCDVDSDILKKQTANITKRQNIEPTQYSDFRKLLQNKEIDAVIVGTPDHWHGIIAIEACKAGKDVYVEKPCAHNVHECRMIAKAAKKYNRKVQQGTQQRSGKHFQQAKEIVQSGQLGKISLIRTWACLGRGSIGHEKPTTPPANLDYDFWLGPAPKVPYQENRLHYNWRFMWDYGTGDMGNWGVHWLDIALWAPELGWPNATSCSGGKFVYDDDKEVADTQIVTYDYDDCSLMWELRMWSEKPIENRGTGTGFYGTDQTLIVNRSGFEVYDKKGKVIKSVKPSNNSSVDHAHNFIDGIEGKAPLIAEIETAHISSAVAILGNVALKANEKIFYNPETEKLEGSKKSKLLTRTYRDKWPLPQV